MINTIRRHLGVKLFLSYIAVLLVGFAGIALATKFALPGAFNRHMGLGMRMGRMPIIDPAAGMMPDLFGNFQASFNDALVLALLAAGVAASIVSLLLSRGIVAPVHAMTAASQRIADGQYGERVRESGTDELGRLARSFNQMAEKLEQVETMRRQLIGDVSHELRTPLTAIKGSLEGLEDGILPATPETYQQIYQEADRLSRLVDDLQELSRVEAGAYRLDIHPARLAALVQTTVKRLSPQSRARRIGLRPDLPADLPAVLADEARITQVLTNLVGNALQYTPEGGKVTILAAPHGDEIHISVIDNGIGIPAGHLSQIFTRFYRVDKSRSRQTGGGSGIGLTIAKYLVEAHGGRIWVESAGEGQGSTFTFSLKIVR